MGHFMQTNKNIYITKTYITAVVKPKVTRSLKVLPQMTKKNKMRQRIYTIHVQATQEDHPVISHHNQLICAV